ncbi:ATP-binding cassette domain-containing protein [Pseudoflavonifractor capillosus]|uniref:ATP-binding cassette domain-containing protein n=1 Tax=Pseudoflavonifractor capillosus TaxID=106588 RepID=UPI0019567430|nr:ATP-binding cassette domain-containing protein [Pseudoflavonifractor capillosus]MBM6694151.1 ATP-binding cassette domain-containing protein [Pseudoflavonifractor capillosus]
MFVIENVSKQYGPEYALQHVSMTIGKGMNFLVGASGSGKTTLLKLMSGMEGDFEGEISYRGKSIRDFSPQEKSGLYHSVFGFVWQDFHLLEEATVLENVLLPGHLQEGTDKAQGERLLRQLNLEDLAGQKVKYLSGGQKQRVAIARELMKQPQVLFCDEPTSALDAKAAKATMDILRTLSKQRTVIVVTHDTSLITSKDTVFELDKGELISAPPQEKERKANWKSVARPKLSLPGALRIAGMNLKNRAGRFAVSVLTLLVASTLLLATVSGAIGSSGDREFDKLLQTYGEGILDISLVGSFTGAAGTSGEDEDKPNQDVEQDLSGLYETYVQDPRVEFIVPSQAFDNIQVTVGGQTHTVEQSGNTPVLTKLLSGSIPAGDDFQVVIPEKFAQSLGWTTESALGKTVEFSATINKWVNNQPIAKPVTLQATVCGVADNTVVYEYEGQTMSFTVDDSFFFNRAAIEEVRRQAGIQGDSANMILRAETPEDMISLKDELNQKGIVPLGQFELVEDMVRLNRQTAQQSGSASALMGVLGVGLVAAVSLMTAFLRRREYAIYKVTGYSNGALAGISLAETALAALCAGMVLLVASPLLNGVVGVLFHASILSLPKLAVGVLLTLGLAVLSFGAGMLAIWKTDVASVLKAGEKV